MEDTLVSDLLTKDINILVEHINAIIEVHNKEVEEKERLNNIINKAIEYIENTYIGSILEVHSGYEEEYTQPLLDILKGENNE